MKSYIESNLNINSMPDYTTMSSSGLRVLNQGHSYDWNDITSDNKHMIEFVEFFLDIFGIDVKFEDFKKMNSAERKSLLRDIKINKIIDDNSKG